MKKDNITVSYRWGDSDIIRRIDVRQQDNGRAVAYIYADNREEASQQRYNIRSLIRLKGWGTLSDHRDGQFVLRVNGFKNGDDLISTLTDNSFLHGKPEISSNKPEEIKSKGFFSAIRNNSLRLSGLFYTLGNSFYIGGGIHRSVVNKKLDWGQIGTGVAFSTGDALIALVGGRDDDRQFTSLVSKLKQHYDRQGIEIPSNAAIIGETSTKGKSLGNRLYDFLHEHVNQIKCASEVVGAFFYFNAGNAQKNHGVPNRWKQATAVIFGLGFGTAGLIKEKKIDEEKYATAGPLQKLWMRVQANPLGIAGMSGLSNTLFTSIGAWKEMKVQQAHGGAGNKLYRWDFAAPGAMLFGNSLYAISNKTTGGNIKNDAMIRDVYSVAAQILNKQPDGVREAAIDSTAKFLGERPEIKDTHQQIVVRLKQEMDIQRNNPWFEKPGLPSYSLAPQKHHPQALTPDAPELPQSTVSKVELEHAGTTPQLAGQAL